MCQDITSKLQQHPDVFSPGINAMVDNYNRMKTDTHILSAMHSFGKYTGVARAMQRKGAGCRKAGKTERLCLSGRKHIGVQQDAETIWEEVEQDYILGVRRNHHTNPEHGYAHPSQSSALLACSTAKKGASTAQHELCRFHQSVSWENT